MLTKKIVSGSLALALTASVAMLAGCPGPTDAPISADPTTSASVSADPSTSATATASASVSPTSSASVDPSSTASPSLPPTIDTKPSGDVGQTPDIATRATFNGKVYDASGTPVNDATVSAKSVDPNVSWVGEDQKTINGAYVFRNAPVGARIEIKATKAGWSSKVRAEVIKSNLQGDSLANLFDFGGNNNGIYAIQDEPMIQMVKVNGVVIDKSGSVQGKSGTGFAFKDIPKLDDSVAISEVDPSDLTVELTFTEAVDKKSVENKFRIFSQEKLNSVTPFEIDERNATANWTWSSDGTVGTFKTNKAIYAAKSEKYRYLASFDGLFKDTSGKEALKLKANNLGGFFKFSEASSGDFFTFSVKEDTVKPVLERITVVNDNGGDDTITLNFSKAMDVINYRADNVSDINGAVLTANSTGNYTQIMVGGKVVYSITRLVESTVTIPAVVGPPAVAAFDKKKTDAMSLGSANAISSAKLDPTAKKLTLTFKSTAFNSNERILVSVGDLSDPNLTVTSTTGTTVAGTNVATSGTIYKLTDPAGNEFSTSNSSTSGGVRINDSQKVVTAGG